MLYLLAVTKKKARELVTAGVGGIAATCVDLAGAEYPKKVGDVAITPLEGTSLVAAFGNKPLDRDLILRLARDHEALITIEEGAIGGFASHVAQLLAEEGVFDAGLKFRSMVFPDTFIDQDSPAKMYAAAAMNAEHIEAKVLGVLGVAQVGARRA